MELFLAVIFVCSQTFGSCAFVVDEKPVLQTESECTKTVSALGNKVLHQVPDADIKMACLPVRVTKT